LKRRDALRGGENTCERSDGVWPAGKTVQALELFCEGARNVREGGEPCLAELLDLYQALLLFHEGRHFEARRLCVAAAAFFDDAKLRGKAVIAHLLLARIALQLGDAPEATRRADAAAERLSLVKTAVLEYQVHFLLGQIAQKEGDLSGAHNSYQVARQALESLRTEFTRKS